MKKRTKPFEVGDKVTTDYYHEVNQLIRTVIAIAKDDCCNSGYGVSVDGGSPCPCCGKCTSVPIQGVDSAWFKKVGSKK